MGDDPAQPSAPIPVITDTQANEAQSSGKRTQLFSGLGGLFSRTPRLNNGDKMNGSANGGDHHTPHHIGQAIQGDAPKTRREMIERVIAFDAKRVFEVMVPLADICAVEEDTSIADLIKIFSEAGHSRLPVYQGDLDDPRGMVHIKDLMAMIAEDRTSGEHTLKDIQRKILYVPPSMKVIDLFLRMQASRIHMALVIDEYGGTDGLVTIEDVIEEIVGDIHDEHDDDITPQIKANTTGDWEADARVELSQLEQEIGTSLNDEDEDVDTLGGLVFSLAGRVPLRGEVIEHPSGFEFEIADADSRKIRKIRIRPINRKRHQSSPSAVKTLKPATDT